MSVGGRELDLGQGPGPSPGPPTTSPTCPTIPCPSQTCPTCQPAVPCPTCPTAFNRTCPSRTALQTADDNHAQQLVSSAVQINHLQVFIGGGATISLHQLPPDEAVARIHMLLSFQTTASDLSGAIGVVLGVFIDFVVFVDFVGLDTQASQLPVASVALLAGRARLHF